MEFATIFSGKLQREKNFSQSINNNKKGYLFIVAKISILIIIDKCVWPLWCMIGWPLRKVKDSKQFIFENMNKMNNNDNNK